MILEQGTETKQALWQISSFGFYFGVFQFTLFLFDAIAQYNAHLKFSHNFWLISVFMCYLAMKMEVNNEHYRHILLYYFKKDKRAEAHKKIRGIYVRMML